MSQFLPLQSSKNCSVEMIRDISVGLNICWNHTTRVVGEKKACCRNDISQRLVSFTNPLATNIQVRLGTWLADALLLQLLVLKQMIHVFYPQEELVWTGWKISHIQCIQSERNNFHSSQSVCFLELGRDICTQPTVHCWLCANVYLRREGWIFIFSDLSRGGRLNSWG